MTVAKAFFLYESYSQPNNRIPFLLRNQLLVLSQILDYIDLIVRNTKDFNFAERGIIYDEPKGG
jgi:hypothetical protein